MLFFALLVAFDLIGSTEVPGFRSETQQPTSSVICMADVSYLWHQEIMPISTQWTASDLSTFLEQWDLKSSSACQKMDNRKANYWVWICPLLIKCQRENIRSALISMLGVVWGGNSSAAQAQTHCPHRLRGWAANFKLSWTNGSPLWLLIHSNIISPHVGKERSWGSDGDEMNKPLPVWVRPGFEAVAASLMGWDPTARKNVGKSVSKWTFKLGPGCSSKSGKGKVEQLTWKRSFRDFPGGPVVKILPFQPPKYHAQGYTCMCNKYPTHHIFGKFIYLPTWMIPWCLRW